MEETLVFLDAGFLSKLSGYFGDGKYLLYDIIKFSKHLNFSENTPNGHGISGGPQLLTWHNFFQGSC